MWTPHPAAPPRLLVVRPSWPRHQPRNPHPASHSCHASAQTNSPELPPCQPRGWRMHAPCLPTCCWSDSCAALKIMCTTSACSCRWVRGCHRGHPSANRGSAAVNGSVAVGGSRQAGYGPTYAPMACQRLTGGSCQARRCLSGGPALDTGLRQAQ